MILHNIMRHTLWTGISETNVNIITSATRPHAFNNNNDTLLLPTTTITTYNSSHTYQHIRTDKDSYKYTFYPRTIIQWNLLLIHVHEAVTVDAFKALVPVTVLAPIYHV